MKGALAAASRRGRDARTPPSSLTLPIGQHGQRRGARGRRDGGWRREAVWERQRRRRRPHSLSPSFPTPGALMRPRPPWGIFDLAPARAPRGRAWPAAARPADSPPPRAGSHHSTTHADGGARGVVVRRLHLLHLPPSFLRLRLRLGPRVCDGHAVLRAARRPARGGAGRWDEGAEEIAQRDDGRGQPRPLSPPLRKPCSASALTWTSPSS